MAEDRSDTMPRPDDAVRGASSTFTGIAFSSGHPVRVHLHQPPDTAVTHLLIAAPGVIASEGDGSEPAKLRVHTSDAIEALIIALVRLLATERARHVLAKLP